MRRACRRLSRRLATDEGLTLVEMLVAILIVGVILAALAATLVGSLRQNVRSERQVVAAALHTEANERLQASQWQNAVIYRNEVAALTPVGVNAAASPPTFEGLPVATRPAYATPSDRIAEVPEPVRTVTRSDIEFTVYQIVVWVDRDADGVDDTKRFITLVEWDEFGRTQQTRFESERIPTPSDLLAAEDDFRLLQFDIGPSPSVLNATTAATTQDIEVVVRFSEGVATPPPLRFYSLNSSNNLVLRSVNLNPLGPDPAGGWVTWTGTLAAGTYRFPNGPRNFSVTGTAAQPPVRTVTGTSTVEFANGPIAPMDDPTTPGPTPSPSPSPTPSPSPSPTVPPPSLAFTSNVQVNASYCVKNNGRLNQDLDVRIGVSGIDPARPEPWSVVVTFTDSTGQKNINMTTLGGGPPSPSGSTFRYFAARNSSSPNFNPNSSTTFSVIATQAGVSIGPRVSGNVTFPKC